MLDRYEDGLNVSDDLVEDEDVVRLVNTIELQEKNTLSLRCLWLTPIS